MSKQCSNLVRTATLAQSCRIRRGHGAEERRSVTGRSPPWEEQMVNVRVNGQERAFDGDPSMPLMWFLRDELGLTGTKFGCGVSLCGACTVHINGEAVRSCAIIMSDATGKSVTTIEGLD